MNVHSAALLRPILLLGALLLLLAGCGPIRDPGPAAGQEAPGEAVAAAAAVAPLRGRIERFPLPARPGGERSVQAAIGDIVSGATVSLIETGTGKTVSTAVSSADGRFDIEFPRSFVPEASKPYVLEAVKGLAVGGAANRAGAPAARVRTLVASQGGSWQSLSGGGIVIGRATTAVCIVAGHRGLGANGQLDLLGKVSGTAFASAGTAIAVDDFGRVLALVTDALAEDHDPVEAIGYFARGATAATRWGRRGGEVFIQDRPTAPVARGAEVTIRGQHLPGPGPATPSIFIGDAEATIWAIDASRSALTIAVPADAVSGYLRIVQGSATWYGPVVSVAGTVGTLAGSGRQELRDGIGRAASFYEPAAMDIDAAGNVYVADAVNQSVRKISPRGFVTTLAGDGVAGDLLGRGASARFSWPHGLLVAPDGAVFVADSYIHKIKRVAPDGTVTWFSGSGTRGFRDGLAPVAGFWNPQYLAIEPEGSLVVSDVDNVRIRRISAEGEVSSVAGAGSVGFRNGPAAEALFRDPAGVAIGPGGTIYVADYGNHCIRRIAGGTVTTFAGLCETSGDRDGRGTAALFYLPIGLAFAPGGDLFVTDYLNHRIRRVSPEGDVSTVAGQGSPNHRDGTLFEAMFHRPRGIAVDAAGNLYVADAANDAVRVVTP